MNANIELNARIAAQDILIAEILCLLLSGQPEDSVNKYCTSVIERIRFGMKMTSTGNADDQLQFQSETARAAEHTFALVKALMAQRRKECNSAG